MSRNFIFPSLHLLSRAVYSTDIQTSPLCDDLYQMVILAPAANDQEAAFQQVVKRDRLRSIADALVINVDAAFRHSPARLAPGLGYAAVCQQIDHSQPCAGEPLARHCTGRHIGKD